MKWAFVLLCLVLLAPLALVDVPPLLDYPNHLARAVVLAAGASDPLLSRMYAAHWTIIPNLGTDLVLPPLLHVLPVHLAGRIVIATTLLLPVAGTIAYHRAIFGGLMPGLGKHDPSRHGYWPLASALVAYNATLLSGFLNFVAGIGIALLLASGWILWREHHPVRTVMLATAGAVALFFCHLMGLVFFYILVGCYEFEQQWRRGWHPARITALVPPVVVSLCLYLISPLAPISGETQFASLADKARELIFPFANYILSLDIATACVIGALVLACIATHRCRAAPGSLLALLLTGLLFLATPWAFKGTYFLDARFVVMFGFLLFGSLQPAGLSRLMAFSAATLLTLLFGIRMAVVMFAWHAQSHDLADLRRVIATVQPGERVLVASVSPEEAPNYWQNVPLSRRLSVGLRLDHHLPALLLIEHRAFWPFMFDNPSQQPVMTLQPYRALSERAAAIPDHRALAMWDAIDLCGYDDVLLLDAGGEPDLAHFVADRLTLVSRSDIAALFRVRPSACAS